jgi:hypothetical protein
MLPSTAEVQDSEVSEIRPNIKEEYTCVHSIHLLRRRRLGKTKTAYENLPGS